MTVKPPGLLACRPAPPHPMVIAESRCASSKYAFRALGTFGLLTAVGVAMYTSNRIPQLGISAVLTAMIYAEERHAAVHRVPAIRLAVLLRHGIGLGDAAAHRCAHFVGALWAAIAWHVLVGPVQRQATAALLLGAPTLVVAVAAHLSFAFVLSRLVLSVVGTAINRSNRLFDLALGDGVAVLVGTVDIAGLFGGAYLISQVIAGAFAAVTFLMFGSTGR
jgi:hypothetical protein